MSGKITGAIYELDLPNNKQSILLAMGDHADHNGYNVRPSVGLIAWKTGYSERQVQRIIQSLRDDGILVPTKELKGKPVEYWINIKAGKLKSPYVPKARQNVTPATPDKMSPPTSESHTHPRHPDVIPGGDIQMSDDPSIKPSDKPSKEKDSPGGGLSAAMLLLLLKTLSSQPRKIEPEERKEIQQAVIYLKGWKQPERSSDWSHVNKLVNFFAGTIKPDPDAKEQSIWYRHQFSETPLSALEIVGFRMWWSHHKSAEFLPERVERLIEVIGDFRLAPDYEKTIERAKTKLARLMGQQPQLSAQAQKEFGPPAAAQPTASPEDFEPVTEADLAAFEAEFADLYGAYV